MKSWLAHESSLLTGTAEIRTGHDAPVSAERVLVLPFLLLSRAGHEGFVVIGTITQNTAKHTAPGHAL